MSTPLTVVRATDCAIAIELANKIKKYGQSNKFDIVIKAFKELRKVCM